jgi:hypothetical protein
MSSSCFLIVNHRQHALNEIISPPPPFRLRKLDKNFLYGMLLFAHPDACPQCLSKYRKPILMDQTTAAFPHARLDEIYMYLLLLYKPGKTKSSGI